MKLHHAAIEAINDRNPEMVCRVVEQLRNKCNYNYSQVCEFFALHTGIDENELDQLIMEGETNE